MLINKQNIFFFTPVKFLKLTRTSKEINNQQCTHIKPYEWLIKCQLKMPYKLTLSQLLICKDTSVDETLWAVIKFTGLSCLPVKQLIMK